MENRALAQSGPDDPMGLVGKLGSRSKFPRRPHFTLLMHRQKLFYFCFILIKTHLKILRLLRSNKNHYHYYYHQ